MAYFIVSEILNEAWQRLKAEARTDKETRQAHIAGIQAKHGKDYRKPMGIGFLVVAALLSIALLLLFN